MFRIYEDTISKPFKEEEFLLFFLKKGQSSVFKNKK